MGNTPSNTKAYRNHRIYGVEGAIQTTESTTIRQVRCTLRGRDTVLVSHRGRQVEVYTRDADGLETFRGYIDDVAPSHGTHTLFEMEINPIRSALQQVWAYEGRKQWSGRRQELNAMLFGPARAKATLAAGAPDPVSARIAQAREAGRQAFLRGAKRVPALDTAVCGARGLLAEFPAGERVAIRILEAWMSGWDAANLAAPVVDSAEEKCSA